jgi:glucokinase
MSLTVGVDVGGTKIAAGVLDERGRVVSRDRAESPATDPVEIVRTIGELVRTLTRSEGVDPTEIEAVGVCAAGFVDKARSSVVFAPNLAWRNEPLKQHLERELDLPVVVENDANAAAWGEFTFGAGEDVEDLLMLTIGTGVGGGIVMDGELVRGGFGMGAEVGHIQMVPGGVRCGCGNLGCLESYGSGSALVRMTREHALSDPGAARRVVELAGGDPARIDGPLVTEAARAGDAFALDRLAELGDWIGQGIATLTAVLDPNVVVIGGGVSEAGDLLLDPVRRSFENHVTVRSHRPLLEVRQAQLGNAGGMVGVADLARRR